MQTLALQWPVNLQLYTLVILVTHTYIEHCEAIIFCHALNHSQSTMEYHTLVQAEQGTENSELVVVSVPAHLNTTPHQCTDQHSWSSQLVITHYHHTYPTRHCNGDQQTHSPHHTHQCMLVWAQGNKMVYYQMSDDVLWENKNTVGQHGIQDMTWVVAKNHSNASIH